LLVSRVSEVEKRQKREKWTPKIPEIVQNRPKSSQNVKKWPGVSRQNLVACTFEIAAGSHRQSSITVTVDRMAQLK
jgi:hypothetical protein